MIINFGRNNVNNWGFRIQGKQIQVGTEYKYLGIWLSNRKNYLDLHEQNLIKKAKRKLGGLSSKAFWSYNRFEILRTIWKSIGVPSLTTGNAILVIKSEINQKLDTIQRQVGRLALGCGDKIANEYIQGELGWSLFSDREAESMIKYKGRLENMGPERWPKAMYVAKNLWGAQVEFQVNKTAWGKRVNH